MKKYIVSILVASVFLIGAPFMAQKVSAADLNIRDFVNLLVAIGVITPDKLPAVNAFLLTLDNNTEIAKKPSIKVTSPNGGEVIVKGSTYNIMWNMSQPRNPVIISLVDSNGNSITPEEWTNLNNGLQSFSWQVPKDSSVPNGTYKMRVCDKNPPAPLNILCDSSDSYFSLVSDNGDGSLYPSLDLLEPEANGLNVTQNGVTYPVSGQIDTTWCKTTNPSSTGNGPFEFNWNDGSKSCSWFPATHTYASDYQFGQSGAYKITVRVKNTTGLISERYKMKAIGQTTAIYPVCGSAQNVARTSMPITNLCSVGNVGKVSGASTDGTDRWFWGCIGENTEWKDDTVWCFAPKIASATSPSVMYPVCGTERTTCQVGTLGESGITADGTNRWYWACVGRNTDWTNDTTWCFAPKN